MKSALVLLAFGLLATPSAFAVCDYEDDFNYVETTKTWETNLIQDRTYVDTSVTSKIGEFHLSITGGIYEEQLVSRDKYECKPSDNISNFEYRNETVVDTDGQSEKVTDIAVTFPNGYKIASDSDTLTKASYDLTSAGLVEVGPFAPVGPLSNSDTIIAIGKLTLKDADYQRLKTSF